MKFVCLKKNKKYRYGQLINSAQTKSRLKSIHNFSLIKMDMGHFMIF